MKNALIIAGILAIAFSASAAIAQGGAEPPMTKAVNETGDEGTKLIDNEDGLKSMARAGEAAEKMQGFEKRRCPTGQKKKRGNGSHSRC